MSKRSVGLAAGVAVVLLSLLVLGGFLPEAGGAEDLGEIQKLRVALMKNNARQMADIQAKLKAGRVKDVRANAEALALHGQLIPRLSPKGSDAPPTRMLPAIWQNLPDFARKSAAMGEAAAKLASIAAKGDAKAAADQFKALGKACASCHTPYRAELKKEATKP